MKKRIFLALLGVAATVLLTASKCGNTTVNNADSTPPTVEVLRISVGDGPWVNIPDGGNQNDPVKVNPGQTFHVNCTGSDTEGMKSLTISVATKTVNACPPDLSSAPINLTPPFKILAPEDFIENAQVIQGVVPKTLFIQKASFSPLKCVNDTVHIKGDDGNDISKDVIGTPIEQNIRLECRVKNNSSNANNSEAVRPAFIRYSFN